MGAMGKRSLPMAPTTVASGASTLVLGRRTGKGYARNMFFAPRIRIKPLVGLCRRLSTALEAGIDARTVWSREATRASGPLGRHLSAVSAAIDRGESLADALAPTGDFFPTLFRELVGLGEQTGHLDAVLAQLADHYQNQLVMRRNFWASIAWPLIQLGLAVLIVGFLIWITGIIREMTGNRELDMLGFGLVGNQGLMIYLTFLAGAGVLFWLVIRAITRGLVWSRPIQRFVLRLPGIGQPLQTLALSRLAWSMHVTLNAGMEIRKAMRLSLRSTQSAYYTDQIPLFDAEISAGNSIHETFCRAGGYPVEFLDTLAVGEQSGKVVESMGLLARQYQDRARAALAMLTLFAGWAVWLLIAILLIALIFRMFSFYLGAINNALKM
jgi:type II secretory pathway component PulF